MVEAVRGLVERVRIAHWNKPAARTKREPDRAQADARGGVQVGLWRLVRAIRFCPRRCRPRLNRP